MTMTRLIVVLAGLLSLTGVLAGPASATTVEDCQAQLGALRAAVEVEPSFVNPVKDRTGLLGKLDAAAAKLAEGKNADAIQKLTNFQDTLRALADQPKPKIDPVAAQRLAGRGDPATLQPGAQDVIDCINKIGTV